MKFDPLFTPLELGPITLKNRFVVPPMGNNFANTDGTWSRQSLAYYAERAKGGFGLITIEATVVHEGAKGGPRKPCLYNDNAIPSLAAIVQACHQYGAKVSVQLQHAGPEGNAVCAGAPLQAASSIPSSCGRDVPEPVPTEQVYELVRGYGDAARRALKAGVDAVEIHMAHGYLVSSFLSPRTNKRTDEFGGSFENRMRFPRLIVEEVRNAVGDRLAILARINSADEEPGGLDIHDSAAIARALQEAGVDGLHVSRAVHLKDEFMWAPTAIHGGFSADLITEIKRAVDIPVITVGRFTEPHYASLLVEQDRTDLVAFGRQSLADPALPEKAYQDRLEDLFPCIACLQGCVVNMYQGKPIRCLVNPALGHEAEPPAVAVQPRSIAVIGGGPAGMVAAFTAAERGHNVTLYEKSNSLGGNMILASYPPGKGDIVNMIRAYIVRCKKAGVDIRLNNEMDLEAIAATQPDAVVVATGADPLVLPIDGINDPALLFGGDVLAGRQTPGKRVLVVGGGMVGCEIADFLGELQHDVTIIESRDNMGADMISEHRKLVMNSFQEYGIRQVNNAKVCRFYPDGVEYETPEGTVCALRGFDSVVLAMGYRNNDTLSEALIARGIETHTVGDAVRARRALDATAEAFEVASKL